MSCDSDLQVIDTEEELATMIQEALDEAGTTLAELREQARRGRFDSEDLRLTWFAVAPWIR